MRQFLNNIFIPINTFIFLIFFLLSPFSVNAESIVAIIQSTNIDNYNEIIDSLKSSSVRLKGYTFIEYCGDGTNEKLLDIIKEINNISKPVLIVTVGIQASVSAINNFTDTPIVFCGVFNWDKYFEKKNNVTGISLNVSPELDYKYIKLAIPNLKKIGFIYNPIFSEEVIYNFEKAGKKEKIKIVTQEIEIEEGKANVSQIKKAFEKMQNDIDAFYLLPDASLINEENYNWLKNRCSELKMPLFTYNEEFVNKGIFASLSPNYSNIGSQAANLIFKILIKKQKPKNLETLSPIGSNFVININTALKLGLKTEYLKTIVNKIYE